jgi:hypothetical protein
MRLIAVPLARLGAKTWSPGLAIPESRVAHFKSERYPGIASWGISAVPFDELRAGSTGLVRPGNLSPGLTGLGYPQRANLVRLQIICGLYAIGGLRENRVGLGGLP